MLSANVAVVHAQIVSGTVTEAESKAPLAGVFIVLLDSVGQVRGGVLTDNTGAYALQAPGAGTFRLRAERIGHESTTSPAVMLAAHQRQSVHLSVPIKPIELTP